MASTILLSDNGVSSGSAGLKQTAGNDGVLILQTTTSGGTATNAVYVSALQNVGIGANANAYKLTVVDTAATSTTVGANIITRIQSNGSGADANIQFSDGVANSANIGMNGSAIYFAPAGTERMRINSSGNVGIGTSSPASKLAIVGPTGNGMYYSDGTVVNYLGTTASSRAESGTTTNHPYSFITYGVERARIDTSGYLLVGKTASNVYVNGFEIRPEGPCYATISSSTGSSFHLLSSTSGTFRFYVTETGGVANYSGNNVNLSDERTKKNIEVVSGYLAKICAIPVKMFNYKDEAEGDQRTLGVIAQDVEAVAPEFVNSTDGWKGADSEDGTPLKTIYTTDMMFGLMNAIQEQQALITTLTERITALEAK